MLKDILVGQYFPGNSPLHRMNAAMKIILTLIYLIMIFVVSKPLSYIVVTVYTALLVVIAGVPFGSILRGILPLKWILLVMVIFNLFAAKGEPLVQLYVFSVSREGICMALSILVRIILIVTSASILTLTTPPLEMTNGIEILLKPLDRIKIPSGDIAMIMSIAIRFIPALSEEADKIMKAQTARGADFTSGGIIRRARAMLPIMIPLFVNAFRRADELALAMESRCYGGGKRTKMKESRITALDIKAAAVFIPAAAIIALTEIMIEF